jgi:CHASE3 domain sensor protein
MSRKCSKYKDKLSAYMDGQLTSREMAKIADHLKECSLCTAELEELRLLNALAEDSMPEFEDSILDELESRISNQLDSLPERKEATKEKKARIVPVWYRYTTVAASIVIVIMIGRVAFKDVERELLSPESETILMYSPSQPDEVPTPVEEPMTEPEGDTAIPEKVERLITQPTAPASRKKGEMDKPAPEKPRVEKSEPAAIPEPIETKETPDELIESEALEGEGIASQPKVPSEDDVGEVSTGSRGGGDTIAFNQTGTFSVMAKDKSAAAATSRNDDVIEEYAAEDSSSLVGLIHDAYSKTREEAAKRQTDKTIALVPMAATVDESATERIETSIDQLMLDEVRGLSQDMASETAERLGNRAVRQSTYKRAESKKAKSNVPILGTYRDSLIRVHATIDSLIALPIGGDTETQLNNLYLRTRTSYEVYRLSENEDFYDWALQLRDSLRFLINKEIENGNDVGDIKKLAEELDKWEKIDK